jgi:AcrR family transcriptional regulator
MTTPKRGSRGDSSARTSKTDGAVHARATAPRSVGDGPRTRGGWTPAGTAAERRAVHTERGTARGERTRRQIIDAARRVFERDGYLEVGVEDIVQEAGVARGSFYTYFTSKLEVLRVVSGEVAQLVDEAVLHRPEGERRLDPVEALRRANERYVAVYRDNARIYALGEQLAHIDKELLEGGMERRRRNIDRITRLIRRWQAQGLADPSVDAEPTAAALVSMITNVCYWLFVGHDEPYDVDRAAAAINDLWIRAVDLRRRPNRRWLELA